MGKIQTIYKKLEKHFGDLAWWPAETGFEVIIGTILTQSTSWRNAEKAIVNLKEKCLLTAEKIIKIKEAKLSSIIRPAGYHHEKAKRLKEISRFVINECGGQLDKLKKRRTGHLREILLRTRGVGPETADSILLYALDKPVFVVDAYTKRIFSRHKLISRDASYNDVQCLVRKNFPVNTKKLNQFHALLVETAKKFCRKKFPLCSGCPLENVK